MVDREREGWTKRPGEREIVERRENGKEKERARRRSRVRWGVELKMAVKTNKNVRERCTVGEMRERWERGEKEREIARETERERARGQKERERKIVA